VYECAADGSQKAFSFLVASHSYSAGGIYASAADLAKWASALDAGRLLAPAYQEQMWIPPRLDGGAVGSFGVGWAVGRYHGRRTVGHSGGPALADILRFPDDKLTIIVLANQQKCTPTSRRASPTCSFPRRSWRMRPSLTPIRKRLRR
jgi:CubicO group peptidase (beta-lactamase class C family)